MSHLTQELVCRHGDTVRACERCGVRRVAILCAIVLVLALLCVATRAQNPTPPPVVHQVHCTWGGQELRVIAGHPMPVPGGWFSLTTSASPFDVEGFLAVSLPGDSIFGGAFPLPLDLSMFSPMWMPGDCVVWAGTAAVSPTTWYSGMNNSVGFYIPATGVPVGTRFFAQLWFYAGVAVPFGMLVTDYVEAWVG